MAAETNPYRVPRVDPSRFSSDSVRRPLSRRKLAGWLLAYFYPLAACALFYSSWLVAWASLGHMPRPMLDDPKSINTLVDIMHTAAGLALVSAPVLAPVCSVSSFFCPLRLTRNRILQGVILVVAYVAMCTAIIMTMRADPGRVVDWWFD